MTALLALLGCAERPPDPDTTAHLRPFEDHAEAAVAEPVTPESGPPTACPEPIYEAQTGWDVDEPALADPHAAVLGAAPTPFHLHRGWTDAPSTSAAFVWRTDADTLATQIQIGPTEALGTTLDGASFLLVDDAANGRIHEARICGLQPGTTWHYRVGGEGAWSNIYSFTTAPAPGSDVPIVFGVAGDTRGGTEVWSQILAGMASHGVEFRLFTGDAVTTGSTVSQWDDWYEAGTGYHESVPTILAHGNHEGLSQAHFGLAALPGNEEWYAFEYGDVFFAALNDTPGASTDWATQAEWLGQALAATERTWRITFHHKPAYSGCRPNGEDLSVREHFVPVKEAGGVQLDLAGHNHNYERSKPLLAGAEVAQADGITYVVTAGGGAPLYDNNQNWSYTATYAETEHYVIARLQGDELTLTAYDLGGNVIDTVTLAP